ncbi:MAG: SdpI family protein [Moorellaceae bacterium]
MESYRLDKRMLFQDWPAIVILIIMLVAGLIIYPYLPERVPIHWNAAGQVDNYGSRTFGAFMLPLLTAGLYLLMLVLPLVDPRKENYPKFLGAYRIIRLALVLFMAVLYGIMLVAALGYYVPMDRIMPALLGLLFILIGNYLPRVRYNYFVGIRTPWTLADEEVWRRTHRWAGTLYVLAGFLSLLTAFWARGVVAFVVVIAALMLASLLSVIYSLVIFRQVSGRT